ncbi:Cyclin-T1-4 [Diplonema papillatum]|nr:Cyclin-T1-4 [Diplonema papillatum]
MTPREQPAGARGACCSVTDFLDLLGGDPRPLPARRTFTPDPVDASSSSDASASSPSLRSVKLEPIDTDTARGPIAEGPAPPPGLKPEDSDRRRRRDARKERRRRPADDSSGEKPASGRRRSRRRRRSRSRERRGKSERAAKRKRAEDRRDEHEGKADGGRRRRRRSRSGGSVEREEPAGRPSPKHEPGELNGGAGGREKEEDLGADPADGKRRVSVPAHRLLLRHATACALKCAGVLQFSPATAATACVLLQRFLTSWFKNGCRPRCRLLHAVAACLMLAGKLCDQFRKTRDLANVMHFVSTGELLVIGELLFDVKEGIQAAEQVVLRQLCFDCIVDLPYKYLLNLARFAASFDKQLPGIAQLATALLNDALPAGIWAETKPEVLAAAALHLALLLMKRCPPEHGELLPFDALGLPLDEPVVPEASMPVWVQRLEIAKAEFFDALRVLCQTQALQWPAVEPLAVAKQCEQIQAEDTQGAVAALHTVVSVPAR